MVEALDHAAPRPDGDAGRKVKKNWSEAFANGCAIAVAREFRRHSELGSKKILPLGLGSGTEPLTPLGAGTEKRIDVTIADTVLGLEIGVSLKGLNFRDRRAQNFDKNLTGRLYELADEVRLVHEHLPHAFMVGIFFLPIESVADKKSDGSVSSFARTLLKLRERTGRLDVALQAHAPRCDASYVALYSFGGDDVIQPGVVRFMNVDSTPPRRGRPRISATMTLSEVVAEIVRNATHTEVVEWSDPERD